MDNIIIVHVIIVFTEDVVKSLRFVKDPNPLYKVCKMNKVHKINFSYLFPLR